MAEHKVTWFAVVEGELVPRKGSGLPYKGTAWVGVCSCNWTSGDGVTATVLDKLIAAHKAEPQPPAVDTSKLTRKECLNLLHGTKGISRTPIEVLRKMVAARS